MFKKGYRKYYLPIMAILTIVFMAIGGLPSQGHTEDEEIVSQVDLSQGTLTDDARYQNNAVTLAYTSDVDRISCEEDNRCLIKRADNTVWVTGGTDASTCSLTWTPHTSPPVQIQNMVINNNVKYVLRVADKFGYNNTYYSYFGLTNGDIYQCNTLSATPTKVGDANFTNMKKLLPLRGRSLTFGLREDGTVWKVDTTIGTTTQVQNLDNVVDISVLEHGSSTGLGTAVKSDGTLWVWGLDAAYPLPPTIFSPDWGTDCIGSANAMKACQVPIISNAVKAISQSWYAQSAVEVLFQDGTIKGWGAQNLLGIGSTATDVTYSLTPIQTSSGVPAGGIFTDLRYSYNASSIAVTSSGKLYIWDLGKYAVMPRVAPDKPLNITKVFTEAVLGLSSYYLNAIDNRPYSYKIDNWYGNSMSPLSTTPSSPGNYFVNVPPIVPSGTFTTTAIPITQNYAIKSISVGATGNIKYFVKLNSDSYYKRWTGTVWTNTEEKIENGMTKEELESIPVSAWRSLTTNKTSITLKAFLQKTDPAPTISSITITQAIAFDVTNVSCPQTLRMGQTGQCSVTVDSPNQNITYQWGSAEGSTGAVFANPDHQITDVYFTEVGTQVVKITASDPALNLSKTVYVVVDVTPLAMTLDANCPENADKLTLTNCTAQAVSEWGTIAYKWTVENNGYIQGSDDGADVSLVFTELGKMAVTVKAYLVEAPLVTLTKTKNIYVNPKPPTISNAACDESIILGQDVSCSISVGGTDSTAKILWNVLDDGAEISDNHSATPTIIFKTPGEKTIKAIAYVDGYSNIKTEKTFTVTVQDNPITANIICPENALTRREFICTFDATATWGNVLTEISVNKGQANQEDNMIKITPTAPGTLNVQLTVSVEDIPWLKKVATATVNITEVKVFTPVITGPKSSYIGLQNTYTVDAPCIASNSCLIKWKISDTEYTGTSLNISFPVEGKYILEVSTIANDSPLITVSYAVYISALPKPSLYIDGPGALFVGNAETYKIVIPAKYNGLAVTGEWILPDGTRVADPEITIDPTAEGYITIMYETWIDGYKDITLNTMKKRIHVTQYIFPEPKIKIRSIEGKAPYNATFLISDTYKRTPGAKYNINYTWKFSDTAEPLVTDNTIIHHVFTKAGSYTVTMTATDNKGNTSKDTITITAGVPPVEIQLKISSSNKYMRVPLAAYVRAAIKRGSTLDRLESYEWKLDDEPIIDAKPEYARVAFTEPGIHTISYTAKMISGAINTETAEIEVQPNQLPTCDIAYTDDPKSRYVYLKAICSDPDGRISSYKWDFDDGRGVRAGTVSASFIAKTSKIYNITLIAADDTGDTVTVQKEINIVR